MDLTSANSKMYNWNLIREAKKTAYAPTTTTSSDTNPGEERWTATLCPIETHPSHTEERICVTIPSLRSNTNHHAPYYRNTYKALETLYNETSATLRQSLGNMDEIQTRVSKIVQEIEESDMVYNHLRQKHKAFVSSVYKKNKCDVQKNISKLNILLTKSSRCLQKLITIEDASYESDTESHKQVKENIEENLDTNKSKADTNWDEQLNDPVCSISIKEVVTNRIACCKKSNQPSLPNKTKKEILEKHLNDEEENKIIVKKEDVEKSFKPMLKTSNNLETRKSQLPKIENKTLDNKIRLCNTSNEKPENSRTGLKYIGILDEIQLKDLLPYKSEYPRKDIQMEKPAGGDQFSFLRELVYGSLQDYLLTLIQIQPDLVHSVKNPTKSTKPQEIPEMEYPIKLMKKKGSTDISTWKLSDSKQKRLIEKLDCPTKLPIMPIMKTGYIHRNDLKNIKALGQKNQMIPCSSKCGSRSINIGSRAKPQKKKAKTNIPTRKRQNAVPLKHEKRQKLQSAEHIQ